MKKLLSTIMVFMMLIVMTACGNQTDGSTVSDRESNIQEESSVDDKTDEEGSSDEESKEESEEESEESEEESSEEQDKEDSPTVVAPSNGSVDLSNAATETTVTEPAAFGQWIKSTRYSATSHQYETVYWRAIGITDDCQGDIDRYNNENHLYTFEQLENDDLKYLIVMYEVYYPEEFPAEDWGITSADISLSIKNPEGGGFTYKGVTYIGLSSAYDISLDQEIHPGDVFSGKALFVMVNDDVDYLFEYSHNNENDEFVYDYSASK